ncbi:hypothetical protein OUZ56_002334 [Daphnia magna]|uniref:Uncharacterized protein n=1 Tax=Daphnia magna TaxID=35525 RepID=A0ABR0A5U1_9CRUS|nr:hypothetical protein OUZ56_002334 [Daphnia magna]
MEGYVATPKSEFKLFFRLLLATYRVISLVGQLRQYLPLPWLTATFETHESIPKFSAWYADAQP